MAQMAVSQDVVILHGPFRDLERKTKKGVKRRTRIDVESTPIVHDFDSFKLGKGPSEAIRDYLRLKIKQNSSQVSPSTQRAREKAVRAYQRGAKWAVGRYSGGRTGATPPDASRVSRGWFFSGRFANGLFVRDNPKEKSWSINVPANRLNNLHHSQNDGQYKRMLDSLRAVLPELDNPRELTKSPEIQKAVRESIRDVIMVAGKRGQQLTAKRRREALKLIRQLGGTARLLAGI